MNFLNKINLRNRKIIGIIFMMAGFISIFFVNIVNIVGGLLLLFVGLWILNPGKNDGKSAQLTVSSWWLFFIFIFLLSIFLFSAGVLLGYLDFA